MIKQQSKNFEEFVGDKVNGEVLQKIVYSPDQSPQVLLFYGKAGTGKTTSARLFAALFNCLNKTNNTVCGNCDNCTNIFQGVQTNNYWEIDCSMVSSMDGFNDIKSQILNIKNTEGYKVIVFDEAHMFSEDMMTALLKVIDDCPKELFFIFITTDINRIVKTIVSRSLILYYQILDNVYIRDLIDKEEVRLGISLSDETKDSIFQRSCGHPRDALIELKRVQLLGQEKYCLYYKNVKNQVYQLIGLYKENRLEEGEKLVLDILRNPVSFVKSIFDTVLTEVSYKMYIKKDVIGIEMTQYKAFVGNYLRSQSYLENSDHWYSYLVGLAEIFHKREAYPEVRFQKQ